MAFRRLLCGARCALAGGGASFVSCDAPETGQPRLFSRQKQMPCPRYSTPLGRRYAGTSAARSKRATMLMSDPEVSATARIINNFVDLDYYDEDEEQEIFESGAAPSSFSRDPRNRPSRISRDPRKRPSSFSRDPRTASLRRFSVCRLVEDLAASLPNETINLVHSESALPEADAAAFEKRMFDWLLERADLPYLDAADQRCVIHSLLVLLMRSMRKRKSAVGALSDLETHHLVLDVFVKSTIDIFNDPARRRQLAERIEAYVSAIPFFPAPLLAHVIDFFCGHASAVITPVLVETYNEHLRHSDAYAEMALRSAGEVAADAKPFEARLRANLVRALAKETGRSRVAALGMTFIPEPHFFIDPFLESINTEKLEDVMRSLVLDDALQRELVHRPLRVPDEADGHAAASVATAAAAAGAAKMRRKRRR